MRISSAINVDCFYTENSNAIKVVYFMNMKVSSKFEHSFGSKYKYQFCSEYKDFLLKVFGVNSKYDNYSLVWEVF